jgi:hypothetical protein
MRVADGRRCYDCGTRAAVDSFGETRMKDKVISERFNNLDRRLSNVEQILPTLATKGDLKAFATRDELNEGLKTLETTLRGEIRETRRHMDVIGESLRGDIQLIAENLAALMSRRSGG